METVQPVLALVVLVVSILSNKAIIGYLLKNANNGMSVRMGWFSCISLLVIAAIGAFMFSSLLVDLGVGMENLITGKDRLATLY